MFRVPEVCHVLVDVVGDGDVVKGKGLGTAVNFMSVQAYTG